jgi:hypothetical protein
MKRILPTLLAALFLAGCGSSERAAPRLTSRLQLGSNAGQLVEIDGTAHFLRAVGPSVAGDDFEIRILPRAIWGADMDGRKVRVIGRLNNSSRATPPDPSFSAGEYWLSDTTWKPVPLEKK